MALFDFTPSESNQLALKAGVRIIVIGKEGDNKGWWRGRINDKVRNFFKLKIENKKL